MILVFFLLLVSFSPSLNSDTNSIKKNVNDTNTRNNLILEDTYDVDGLAQSTALIIDIDDDNELEIIYGGYGKLLIFNFSDGTFNLEDSLLGSMVGITHSCPAVADLDNDNKLEIAIGSTSKKLHIFSHNGISITEEDNFNIGTNVESPIAIGDVDDDGELEIICGDSDFITGKVYVFNHSLGSLSLEATYTIGTKCRSGACIADFDNDGYTEFAIADYNGQLYIFRHNGQTISLEHMRSSGIAEWTNPSCADLDFDNDLEIIFASNDETMYVFDHTLATLDSITSDAGFETSPAIGDIDFDGEIEFIYTGPGIFICNLSGNQLNIEDSDTSITSIFSSPAIGDIDNDGYIEIIFGSNDNFLYIYEYKNNVLHYETSFEANDDVFSSPVFADVDLDGKTEIFVGSEDNYLYAFECWGNHTSNQFDWTQFAFGNENQGFVDILPIDQLYVDDDFTTETVGWNITHFNNIQKAINKAVIDASIFVYNGTYYEHIVVNKTLNITGENNSYTIIDGQNTGDVIKITADNCSISQFTIYHGGQFPDTSGVDIRSNNNIVTYNVIIQNNYDGITCYSSANNTFEDNVFIYNRFGIRLYNQSNHNIFINNVLSNQSDHAIFISYSHNNIIEQNDFISNLEDGIRLIESSNNSIVNNFVSNNIRYGIMIASNSNNNLLSNNNVQFNNQANASSGIRIYGLSDNNQVYHNNIIDNGNQNAIGCCTNIWDNDYPSGGNYWSDYTGIDADGDGIGDTSYSIYGSYFPDYYPFMQANGWLAGIDINQSIQDRGFPIRHAADGDWSGAQNFIPTLGNLTKIEIYLRKFGSPEFNLTIQLLKDSINGPILDSITISKDEVPSIWTWLELDFTDVMVEPGLDYFIKCPPAPSGVTTSFGYEWGYAFGNQYDDGAFWFTRDGGNLWRDLPTMYEFTFRTYGEL